MAGVFSGNSWSAWFLTVSLLWCSSSLGVKSQTATAPLVPAFFIFGDSLVDVGNNNYINSLAKANYYPHGIDFPGGTATGRFCNGKTVLDFISQYIGLPYPPPYLAPSTSGAGILQGVNYASGAGGILDSTGSLYIERISFDKQLQYFQNTINQLNLLEGPAVATTLLNEALYSVVFGSNDYINNYLQTTASPTKDQYTPAAYQQYLLNTFSQQLTTMYNLGARKVVVSNVGPLGCIPQQISMVSTNVQGACIPGVNDLVVGFNEGLSSLIGTLNSQLPGAHFVYGNVYDPVLNLANSPQSQGMSVANTGCCGVGRFNGQAPCLPGSTPCSDRSGYVFWDPFHPTEHANNLVAAGLWSGGPGQVFPVNIQQLVAM